jgi:HTH-type transcriptional regulator / antitoxin HigA
MMMATIDIEKCGALLADTLPQVIQSDEEYDRLAEIFNHLMNKGENLSPEEDLLFDLLANLLEDFERRTLPPLD